MVEREPVTMPLQDAFDRAKTALAAGDTGTAIAVAGHMLRYYPQFVDAFMVLGEAHLEQAQTDEAGHFFTHVLNADPQNVLAHVGRAILAEERGQIQTAIDSYECAFEIEPGIDELRSELLRLYRIRFGSAGATIRTTPSGLAYMHLRAGLREAAIAELGYLSQTRPDRWDLDVALVEALWRNEQLGDAEAVATEVLATHATCVKCLWILGYLHWTSLRAETGRDYLVAAVALDPTYRIATTIWDTTPWPLDRAVARAQPAPLPGWPPEADGDAGQAAAVRPEAHPASTRATVRLGPAPVRPTTPLPMARNTEPFGLRPPLPAEPPESPGMEEPLGEATRDLNLADLQLPQAALAPMGDAVGTPPAADPPAEALDYDWFDDWVIAADTPPGPVPAEAGASDTAEAGAAGTPEAPALPDAAGVLDHAAMEAEEAGEPVLTTTVSVEEPPVPIAQSLPGEGGEAPALPPDSRGEEPAGPAPEAVPPTPAAGEESLASVAGPGVPAVTAPSDEADLATGPSLPRDTEEAGNTPPANAPQPAPGAEESISENAATVQRPIVENKPDDAPAVRVHIGDSDTASPDAEPESTLEDGALASAMPGTTAPATEVPGLGAPWPTAYEDGAAPESAESGDVAATMDENLHGSAGPAGPQEPMDPDRETASPHAGDQPAPDPTGAPGGRAPRRGRQAKKTAHKPPKVGYNQGDEPGQPDGAPVSQELPRRRRRRSASKR